MIINIYEAASGYYSGHINIANNKGQLDRWGYNSEKDSMNMLINPNDNHINTFSKASYNIYNQATGIIVNNNQSTNDEYQSFSKL